ncbi:MAG: hypothetical protein PF517_03650 [Salinivirgaceae bacterium]|jgi:hypothetical protein|nr:hypothetical protein [Salinivirgaceae bacterium]
MKKNYNLLLSIAVIASMAFIMSCQGPGGVPGADGTNGTDGIDGIPGTSGNVTCMTCHNETTDYTVKRVQFNESAHSLATRYTSTGECSGCHSTEGFLERANFTSTSDIYDLALTQQTPISCRTCHKVHYDYAATDWDLTIDDEVTESLFGTLSADHDSYGFGDMGNSNQCLQCHQARDRGNVPAADATGEVTTGSTHWGPHYGVQGNVFVGKAGIHIGNGFPTSHSHNNISNACISCHMYDQSHTLAVNYEACVACHTAEQAGDKVAALHTVVHDKLFELGALLEAKGVMTETLENGEVTGYSPVDGTFTADEAKALWNYMVVYQDHSYGTHNPSYIKKLLDNSIALVE